MRLDAKTEQWMPMEIRNVRGWFNDMRIDRDTIPQGYHFWELADEDCDGIPCRYRPGILVNFYGTFITKGELPIDDEEYQSGYMEPEEWRFIGDCSYPYWALLERGLKKEANDEDLWLLQNFNR